MLLLPGWIAVTPHIFSLRPPLIPLPDYALHRFVGEKALFAGGIALAQVDIFRPSVSKLLTHSAMRYRKMTGVSDNANYVCGEQYG